MKMRLHPSHFADRGTYSASDMVAKINQATALGDNRSKHSLEHGEYGAPVPPLIFHVPLGQSAEQYTNC